MFFCEWAHGFDTGISDLIGGTAGALATLQLRNRLFVSPDENHSLAALGKNKTVLYKKTSLC